MILSDSPSDPSLPMELEGSTRKGTVLDPKGTGTVWGRRRVRLGLGIRIGVGLGEGLGEGDRS